MLSNKHNLRVRKNRDASLFQSFAPLQLIKDKKKEESNLINISSENKQKRKIEIQDKPQTNSLQNEQSHLFAGLPNFNNDLSIDNDQLLFSETKNERITS